MNGADLRQNEIGLQPLEAAIQCLLDALLPYRAGAATYPSESSSLRGNLGRDE